MANMIPISTVTVGAGGAASIDFTLIPSTYTDLCLIISSRNASNNGTGGSYLLGTFNGSSASFTAKQIYGNGAAANSNSLTLNYFGYMNDAADTASTFASTQIYIPNYAGSTNKSYSVESVEETNGSTAFSTMVAGLRSNTAAITQITMTTNAGNFAQYSTATLYGIRKY